MQVWVRGVPAVVCSVAPRAFSGLTRSEKAAGCENVASFHSGEFTSHPLYSDAKSKRIV